MGAIVLPVGCSGAMVAMEDRCNIICVLSSALLLAIFKVSFVDQLCNVQKCAEYARPKSGSNQAQLCTGTDVYPMKTSIANMIEQKEFSYTFFQIKALNYH